MVMATQADAHREWHLNSGTPLGLSCPWDACDPANLDPRTLRDLNRQRMINQALMDGEEGDAVINHRGHVHLSVAAVRFCDAPASDADRLEWHAEDHAERLAESRAEAAAERAERYL